MIEMSYSAARANFASLWDRVIEGQEMALLRRRGKEDVVLMPAAEIRSLLETFHILRTPANARRLEEAIAQADAGQGEVVTVDQLREEYGLWEE